MKSMIPHLSLIVAVSTISCLSLSAEPVVETNSLSPAPSAPQPAGLSVAAAPSTGEGVPAKLPYGVEDVVKLSRAQVGEDIILNYVQSSGTIYNLGPQDIVYLRNQGVSANVINAMLNQRKTVPEATAQAAAQAATTAQAAAAQAQAYADQNAAAANAQPAPTYNQPPAAETQAAPSSSSVYVIPSPSVEAAYYGYYRPYGYYWPGYPAYYGYGYPYGGYWGGYWGGGPVVSFGFGFGGRGFHHGGFHGGFHSGGFHSGGFHHGRW